MALTLGWLIWRYIDLDMQDVCTDRVGGNMSTVSKWSSGYMYIIITANEK